MKEEVDLAWTAFCGDMLSLEILFEGRLGPLNAMDHAGNIFPCFHGCSGKQSSSTIVPNTQHEMDCGTSFKPELS